MSKPSIPLPIDSGSDSSQVNIDPRLELLFKALEADRGLAIEVGTERNHAVAYRMQLNRARKRFEKASANYSLSILSLGLELNKETGQWEVIITKRNATPKIREL